MHTLELVLALVGALSAAAEPASAVGAAAAPVSTSELEPFPSMGSDGSFRQYDDANGVLPRDGLADRVEPLAAAFENASASEVIDSLDVVALDDPAEYARFLASASFSYEYDYDSDTCALRADTWSYSCTYYGITSGWCSTYLSTTYGGYYGGECDTTCGFYSRCTSWSCSANDYTACYPTMAPTPTPIPTVTAAPSACVMRADTWAYSCTYYGITSGWCSTYLSTTYGGYYGGECDTTCGFYSTCPAGSGRRLRRRRRLQWWSDDDGPAPSPTFSASPTAPCLDTDAGAIDPYGDGCDDYTLYPYWCGGGTYDDDDFSHDDMCCVCGGGSSGSSGGGYDDDDDSCSASHYDACLPTMAPTASVSPTPSPSTSAPTMWRLLHCDFEGGSCALISSGLEWTTNTGSTYSYLTGPGGDHTTGSGYYLYVEASTPNFPSVGPYTLTTPRFGACVGIVTFSYHMYGSGMGTLELEETTDDGLTWATVWSKSGDQGDSWQDASVDPSSAVTQVRWVGTTGSSYTGDMALDDISVLGESGCFLPTPSPTQTRRPSPSPTSASPTATPLLACDFGHTSGAGYGYGSGGDDDSDACGLDYTSGFGPWVVNAYGTPSGATGPSGDDSASGYGNYMYIESSSPNYPNVRRADARRRRKHIRENLPRALSQVGPFTIVTPAFALCVGDVKFAYHMYGSGMGTLALEETRNGVDWTAIWVKAGDQGNGWRHATVSAALGINQVRFNATTGSSYTSDTAIDNVVVTPRDSCAPPSPAPTLSMPPTPRPSSAPTYSPTTSFAPTATRPQMEITGSCAYNSALDDVYEPITKTATGRVFYRGIFSGTFLFYDPSCNGGSSSPAWIIGSNEPSTTAPNDLDEDGACNLFAYSYGTSVEPPSAGYWYMYCSSGWTYTYLTLAPTRTPVIGTQVAMSGLNCSGFSAAVFNAALDQLVANSTFGDSACADTGAQSIEVLTEVSTPRIHITHGATLQEHVTYILNASIATGTFESTIQALAASSRRLDAPVSEFARRQLTSAMASASVDSVSASTFAPTVPPSPSPTVSPTRRPMPQPTRSPSFLPTFPKPTPKPIPAPTALPVPSPTLSVEPTPLTWRPTVSFDPTPVPVPAPTLLPIPGPTPSPTFAPTSNPTTSSPTRVPTSSAPTTAPSPSPSLSPSDATVRESSSSTAASTTSLYILGALGCVVLIGCGACIGVCAFYHLHASPPQAPASAIPEAALAVAVAVAVTDFEPLKGQSTSGQAENGGIELQSQNTITFKSNGVLAL